jgi:hypothetical protein
MKDFATTSIAALLMAGLYALGSASTHHPDQSKTYPGPVTETVPNKNDTLNTKLPGDTTGRKDSLYSRDPLQ